MIIPNANMLSGNIVNYSEKDTTTRLNKYIANTGLCSRRDADELIKTGEKINNSIQAVWKSAPTKIEMDALETYIQELQKVKPDELKTSFVKLAKKHSQHPSRKIFGDMGAIGYRSIVQPFGKEAFKLKINEMTQKAVKTTLGYHIIYVADRKVKSFQEVIQPFPLNYFKLI